MESRNTAADYDIPERKIEFSFWNQFKALFLKSWRNQIFLLFVFQLVITDIIQSDKNGPGKYNPAIYRPTLVPNSFFKRRNREACVPRVKFEEGVFLYTSDPSQKGEVGTYPGVDLGPLTESLFTVDPNVTRPNSTTGTGLLGSASTSVLDYFGFKGRNRNQAGLIIQQICFKDVFFLDPIFEWRDDDDTLQQTIHDEWGNATLVGGYHFKEVNLTTGAIDYTVYFNIALTRGRDMLPLMNVVANALWNYYVGTSAGIIIPLPTLVGTKTYPQPQTLNDFDFISAFGPALYIFVFMLLFPVFLEALVAEKENKLREIMKMMGLRTQIYWLVTYIFDVMLYMIAAVFAVGLGCALGFRYFLSNAFPLYFLLIFLYGFAITSMAFFFSVFFTKARAATVIGYIMVFGSGLFSTWLVDMAFSLDSTPQWVVGLLMCYPPFAFYRGLQDLSKGVFFGQEGLKWADLMAHDIYLRDVYIFLACEAVIFLLLGLYLELVLPIGPGIKSSPFFCLPYKARRRLMCCKRSHDNAFASTAAHAEDSADVRSERARITKVFEALEQRREESLMKGEDEGFVDDSDMEMTDASDSTSATSAKVGVLVKNLRKVYHSGKVDKVAVHDLTMGINIGECFGFLGPNGAGKSTTINMLCGYLTPSAGDVSIHGRDIRTDLDLIHLDMGVCPQDNVLWGDLTAGEHLEFYGMIKNLTGDALAKEVAYWMEQVQLTKHKHKSSRQFSGGMKRRLCVAIALIAHPRIVLLDEPSTGLDPASRRKLWDVVEAYKASKRASILLTTHSMEEAEALCDRLAIFVGGRLKAIGLSAELKQRLGKGLKITLTTLENDEERAKGFLERIAPGVKLINTLAGTAHYEVKRKDVKVSELFRQLSRKQRKYKIIAWGISNTTLEEVFLKVTMQGQLEANPEEVWDHGDAKTDSSSSPSEGEGEEKEEGVGTVKEKEKREKKKGKERKEKGGGKEVESTETIESYSDHSMPPQPISPSPRDHDDLRENDEESGKEKEKGKEEKKRRRGDD